MPEWLLKKDNYIPLNDKNAYITKSILSILEILIKFKPEAHKRSDIFGVSACIKLITALLLISLVSFSKSLFFILFIEVYVLIIMSLLSIDNIRYILKLGIIIPIFTTIILLPSILAGNIHNSIMMIMKTFLCIVIVNILSCTTEQHEITASLKLFSIPTVFIFVLDITMKYIVILGEFSLNMLYALRVRSIGKNKAKRTSLSAIVGSLFIKSKEMAEEMHGAMECRGFDGEYTLYKKFKLGTSDFVCLVLNGVIVLIYFFIL